MASVQTQENVGRSRAPFSFVAPVAVLRHTGEVPKEMQSRIEYLPELEVHRGGVLSLRRVITRKTGEALLSKSGTVLNTAKCVHVTPLKEALRETQFVARFAKAADLPGERESRTKHVCLRVSHWEARYENSVKELIAVLQFSKLAWDSCRRNAPIEAGKRISACSHGQLRRSSMPSKMNSGLRNLVRSRSVDIKWQSGYGDGSPQSRLIRTLYPDAGGGHKDPMFAKSVMRKREKSVSSRRKNGRYTSAAAAINSIVGHGVIGAPRYDDEPLVLTKKDKMLLRSQQSKALHKSQGLLSSRNDPLSSVLSESRDCGREPPVKRSRINFDAATRLPSTHNRDCSREKHAFSTFISSTLSAAERDESSSAHSTPRVAVTGPKTLQTSQKSNPAIAEKSLMKVGCQNLEHDSLETKEHSSSSRSSRRFGGGIVNVGNTCYLGVAVQALLGDPHFVAELTERASVLPVSSAPFTHALVRMATSRGSEGSSLDPGVVVSAISAHFREFGGAAQQDVHEFITRCFFVLEREMGENILKCPVSKNFSIVTESMNACVVCQHSSGRRFELLRDLSLDICSTLPESEGDLQATPVDELMRNYFASQTLDLTCEVKGCPGHATRTSKAVMLAPRVLVLHLKRFRAEYNSKGEFSLVKVSNRVSIPEILDIQPFLRSSASGPNIFQDGEKAHVAVAQELHSSSLSNPSSRDLLSMSGSFSVPGNVRVALPRPHDIIANDDIPEVVRNGSLAATASANVHVTALRGPFLSEKSSHANRNTLGSFRNKPASGATYKRKRIAIHGETSGLGSPQATEDVEEIEVTQIGNPQTTRRSMGHQNSGDLTPVAGVETNGRDRTTDQANEVMPDRINSKSPGAKFTGSVIDFLKICHENECISQDYGHYMCDVRQPDGSWNSYDDSNVTVCNQAPLFRVDREQDAYVLMYRLE